MKFKLFLILTLIFSSFKIAPFKVLNETKSTINYKFIYKTINKEQTIQEGQITPGQTIPLTSIALTLKYHPKLAKLILLVNYDNKIKEFKITLEDISGDKTIKIYDKKSEEKKSD